MKPVPAGRARGEGAAAREARAFDALVAAAGDFNPFTDRGWDTLARRFAEVAGRDLRLLDVGCGTGASRRVYAARLRWYAGVDLSLGALKVARRSAAATLLQGDALHLPLRDASLDAVAFSSVLHHVPDRRQALAEAYRLLRRGGLVFAFDPNLLHPAMLLLRHPRSPLYTSAGVSPGERPLLPRPLRGDFAAVGFESIGQRSQSDIPYRHVAPRGLARLLPIYNALDRAWEAMGLGRHFGSFVVTWARRP